MKNIGDQAKAFRESKGWNTTKMAKEVGTSRQNIENLEATGNRKPHYIIDLARVMGTTVDELLRGTASIGSKTTKEPSHDAVAIAGILPPTSNVETIGFRRTSDSAEKALRVLADILRPMSNMERDVVANNLRSFAIDPDSAVALSSLLAGLDAANARRRYDPPQQFTGSHGG